jgi:hypothetical protein
MDQIRRLLARRMKSIPIKHIDVLVRELVMRQKGLKEPPNGFHQVLEVDDTGIHYMFRLRLGGFVSNHKKKCGHHGAGRTVNVD